VKYLDHTGRKHFTVKRELRYSKVTGTVRIVKTVELKQADQV
jgi:hypothetical protein